MAKRGASVTRRAKRAAGKKLVSVESVKEPMVSPENASMMEHVGVRDDRVLADEKSKHIRIERDRVVDTDKEREILSQSGSDNIEETGYVTTMIVVNRESRWNSLRRWVNKVLDLGYDAWEMKWIREMILPKKFVQDRVVTRCVAMLYDPGKKSFYMTPVPETLLQHQNVQHVYKRRRWLGLLGTEYYTVLDTAPEPQELFFKSGVSPYATQAKFRLTEAKAPNKLMGKGKYPTYRIEALEARVKGMRDTIRKV